MPHIQQIVNIKIPRKYHTHEGIERRRDKEQTMTRHNVTVAITDIQQKLCDKETIWEQPAVKTTGVWVLIINGLITIRAVYRITFML